MKGTVFGGGVSATTQNGRLSVFCLVGGSEESRLLQQYVWSVCSLPERMIVLVMVQCQREMIIMVTSEWHSSSTWTKQQPQESSQ